MVWLAEKKVFHYILDMGFERLEIPVRVKFEFEVKEGVLIEETLSKKILYNIQSGRHFKTLSQTEATLPRWCHRRYG